MSISNENMYILDLVQAMIGAITPNLRRVALEEIAPRKIRLCFVLEREDPADREEIDDIRFEFEALQATGIEIDVDVLVDSRPIEQIKLPMRTVYGRKE
jgi:hypothetical protein